MELALWIIGAILIVDGILIAYFRRRGSLANVPAFLPLLSMGMGAVALIAAILATG